MRKHPKRCHPQHRNEVRISGGIHRGRKLLFASIEGLRPTPESVRERLFNWLGQDLSGKTVLDLFAGSGVLGFEAASRGAKTVVMCDKQPVVVQQLSHHVRAFGLEHIVHVFCGDAIDHLSQAHQKYDVVLLDPPFVWQDWNTLWPYLAKVLAVDAQVYIEVGQWPDVPTWLSIYRQGKAGKSHYALLDSYQ